MSPEGRHATEPTSVERALLAQASLLVLHINDNTDDQVLFQAACKKADVPLQWHVAESAERGISYLESLVALSREQSVRWPDLVVLDIVLPGATGFKVLEFIRAKPELQLLPVVIFTGLPSREAMDEAYKLGANAFHEKPVAFDDTVKLVSILYQVWSAARRPLLK